MNQSLAKLKNTEKIIHIMFLCKRALNKVNYYVMTLTCSSMAHCNACVNMWPP